MKKTYLVTVNPFVIIKITALSEKSAISQAHKICNQAFSKLKISIRTSNLITVNELEIASKKPVSKKLPSKTKIKKQIDKTLKKQVKKVVAKKGKVKSKK